MRDHDDDRARADADFEIDRSHILLGEFGALRTDER
jgi:hypothetical protein